MDDKTRIIKHGRFYNKVVRFKCACGCVFETTDVNIKMFGEFGQISQYSCYCPECNTYNTISRRDEEDDEWPT